MLSKFVTAYIDDINLFPIFKDSNYVKQVLKKILLQDQLYIEGEKCEFHQYKI